LEINQDYTTTHGQPIIKINKILMFLQHCSSHHFLANDGGKDTALHVINLASYYQTRIFKSICCCTKYGSCVFGIFLNSRRSWIGYRFTEFYQNFPLSLLESFMIEFETSHYYFLPQNIKLIANNHYPSVRFIIYVGGENVWSKKINTPILHSRFILCPFQQADEWANNSVSYIWLIFSHAS
jgi:hypothetical protein